jgi:hypothetical protein
MVVKRMAQDAQRSTSEDNCRRETIQTRKEAVFCDAFETLNPYTKNKGCCKDFDSISIDNWKKSMISGVILTFPILSNKVEAWRRFCQELSGFRRKSYEASRKRFGITCERMSLIETIYGSLAVTTLESPDITQALGQIISSNCTFDIWYRERLQELHGINLTGYEQFSQPEPLPLNQEVHFEWMLNSSDPLDKHR